MPAGLNDRVLLLADDLSGAVETSAAFGVSGAGGLDVLLWPRLPDRIDAVSLCVDLDSRALRPGAARRRVAELLWRVPMGTLLYKKVDSLLRGNVAAELKAVRSSGRGMVVALAVPREARSVRGGVVHVGEDRLTESGVLGSARVVHDRIADALAGIPTRELTIEQVRGAGLESLVAAALDEGAAAICDASTEADLDRIASAIAELAAQRPVAAVGAGGLARSLGRLLAPTDAETTELVAAGLPGRERPTTLFFVGSRSERARGQVAALESSGVAHVVLGRGDVRDRETLAGSIRDALAGRAALLTLSPHERWTRAETQALASVVANVVDEARETIDIVLIGGATARQVLEALGTDRVTPLRELASGTILCATPRGHSVVIRPGSFGTELALIELVGTLRDLRGGERGRAA